MVYGVLADGVLLLHALFVLYAISGGLLALRWPRSLWLHLPVLAWAAAVELAGWPCPLTPLEWWLRAQAGDSGYSGDFIGHYLFRLLYPAQLTRTTQTVLGVSVLLINGVIYLAMWRLSRRRT